MLEYGIDDFKSKLQEKTQATLGVTPTYRVLNQWGEEHRKNFQVAVFLGDNLWGEGEGNSKKEAAQRAAREALENLENREPE